MPAYGIEVDYKKLKARRDARRAALIAKGVIDGSLKMSELLARVK